MHLLLYFASLCVTIIVTFKKGVVIIYMGFIDINDEHKVRITLSNRARITMDEDLSIFYEEERDRKHTTFINTVFSNFVYDAKSSISSHLQKRKNELENLLINDESDGRSKEIAIELLLSAEEQKIKKETQEYCSQKGESKPYHINTDNYKYLSKDCNEDKYYDRPGLYLRSVIEEYCSLPFIQRERIYRKEIYADIESACNEKKILKVRKYYDGKIHQFLVYPYKIVPDAFHTRSYLVCYSREVDAKEKKIASFSMATLNNVTKLSQSFKLSKDEITKIESQLTNYSPTYLVGEAKDIKIKLTENGKKIYQRKLFSRPKIVKVLANNTYVFNCTELQIFNYFASFGADAEIISPRELRNRFITHYESALRHYSTD